MRCRWFIGFLFLVWVFKYLFFVVIGRFLGINVVIESLLGIGSIDSIGVVLLGIVDNFV